MSTAAPRVSVILSAYNAEGYLAAALDSLLAQTFTDLEILAHDDGSTDGTYRILEDYAARDARLVASRGENMGVGAVPNLLLPRARGIYIARMDADDICLPDRFAKQVAFLDAHPDHVMVGGASVMIDADDRPITLNIAPQDHDTIDARNLSGRTAIEHPTSMIRRAALEAVGGYDASLRNCEDLDLWLRLGEIGKLANLPDVVLKYRVHAHSLSGTRLGEQARLTRVVCERAWARRGVTVPFEYRPWRPNDRRSSQLQFALEYGWKAWRAGFRDTWRHYALRAVRLNPTSLPAWKLLVMGALKRSDRAPVDLA